MVSLRNFKACRDISVRLESLTVLAGRNSTGKSSVLQAIVLLRQSFSESHSSGLLLLCGDLIQLGCVKDLLSEGAVDSDEIKIEVTTDKSLFVWSAQGDPSSNELKLTGKSFEPPEFVVMPQFQLLQADRVTPSPMYHQATQRGKAAGFLGLRGENTADYLTMSAPKKVSVKRQVSNSTLQINESLLKLIAPTQSLHDQVAAWLQHISPGVRVKGKRIEGTDENLLQYNFLGRDRSSASNDYRPTNVGFGLTYCLPIVVACLAAEPGSLLIFENPEAHVHPQGQVALGELLALTAADGVQILVETHSDHLLNGIRFAVKREKISHSDVALNFFSRSIETGDSFIQAPAMLSGGRLSDWPDGFFDQWDKSLELLME